MIPEEIRKAIRMAWAKVALRLQKEADVECNGGYMVINIRILVNDKGDAVLWSTPQITKLEPKSSKIEDVIAQILGGIEGSV